MAVSYEIIIKIRANKRWLAMRRKEIGENPSLREMRELKAIDMALKALKTPETAARFRQRLKKASIAIVGGVSGGMGTNASTVHAVSSFPRKRKMQKSEPPQKGKSSSR